MVDSHELLILLKKVLPLFFLIISVGTGSWFYGVCLKRKWDTTVLDRHMCTYLYRLLTKWLVVYFVAGMNVMFLLDMKYNTMMWATWVGFFIIWLCVRHKINENNRFNAFQGSLHPSAFIFLILYEIFLKDMPGASVILGGVVFYDCVVNQLLAIWAFVQYKSGITGFWPKIRLFIVQVFKNAILWGVALGIAANVGGLNAFCWTYVIWAFINNIFVDIPYARNLFKNEEVKMAFDIPGLVYFYHLPAEADVSDITQLQFKGILEQKPRRAVVFSIPVKLMLRLMIPGVIWVFAAMIGVSAYTTELVKEGLRLASLECTYLGLFVVGCALRLSRQVINDKKMSEDELGQFKRQNKIVYRTKLYFPIAIVAIAGWSLGQELAAIVISGLYLSMPHSPIGYFVSVTMTKEAEPKQARLMISQWLRGIILVSLTVFLYAIWVLVGSPEIRSLRDFQNVVNDLMSPVTEWIMRNLLHYYS